MSYPVSSPILSVVDGKHTRSVIHTTTCPTCHSELTVIVQQQSEDYVPIIPKPTPAEQELLDRGRIEP